MASQDATTLCEQAVRKARLGDLSGARVDLDHALLLDPRSTQAMNNRAGVKYQSGDTRGALEDLDQSLALDPSDVVAIEDRALIASMVAGATEMPGNSSESRIELGALVE